MDRLPTLRTERLVLRQLAEADLPALFAVFSDPQVMRYWSSTPMTDLAAAARLLADIDAGRRDDSLYQWGIARAADDSVIGTVTLYAFLREQGRAEIGFALGGAHWSRGYGREAVAGLVRHAFEDLGLRRLEADVDPRNDASLALLAKLGFVREGYLRARWCIGGEVQDSVLLGLLRDDRAPAVPS